MHAQLNWGHISIDGLFVCVTLSKEHCHWAGVEPQTASNNGNGRGSKHQWTEEQDVLEMNSCPADAASSGLVRQVTLQCKDN